MADEMEKTWATTINHVIDGASISDAAFSASSDIDNALSSTNLLDYPLADLVLTCAFATAPSAGAAIYVYRRDMNIVSTNDEPIPDSSYKQHLVGVIVPDLVTTTQYLQLSGVPLAKECEFYLENQCGQAISANWDLDVKPWTFIPGT